MVGQERSEKRQRESATEKSGVRLPQNVLQDAALIHLVLLTESFSELTVSGRAARQPTPTFRDFEESLMPPTADGGVAEDLNALVKGAFRDELCSRVEKDQNLRPIQDLALELHQQIRQLIPSRKDLHSLLTDEVIMQAVTPQDLLVQILPAARALMQLESEARSVTTQQWIEQATTKDKQKEDGNDDDSSNGKDLISFLVTSVLYLLFKTELCQADKHDFYLQHVWAPVIRQQGPALERAAFERRFGGSLDDSSATIAPHTVQWLQMIAAQQSVTRRRTLLQRTSVKARRDLVKVAWIEDILFRSAAAGMPLPEILSLDVDAVSNIREVTRLAAAGCALALHACQSAGRSTQLLSVKQDSVQSQVLFQLMSERGTKPLLDYERQVADAVVALAKLWKAELSEDAAELLRGQTRSVLQGQDPVLQLLTQRMKEGFREVVVQQQRPSAPSALPPISALKSGRSDVESKRSEVYEQVFASRGLAFYARELAVAARQASRVIDLACEVYGDWMDRILLDELSLGAMDNVD
jgi:hypothetical protein